MPKMIVNIHWSDRRDTKKTTIRKQPGTQIRVESETNLYIRCEQTENSIAKQALDWTP